jgi:hypothetical protein
VKELSAKNIQKKSFLFAVGSIYHVKRLTTGSAKNHLGGKYYADDEEVETKLRKWLRQQLKFFYAAGFDGLVKRLDNCINVGGGYVEKYICFLVSNITRFKFYFHL